MRGSKRRARMPRFWAEDGNATVEFTMMSALLVLLFLAALQVGFALYVRNTLIDAAGDGARVAGLVNSSDADGAQHAQDLVHAALGNSYAVKTSVQHSGDQVTMTVTADLPLMGLWGPSGSLTVSGHRISEEGYK